MTTPLPDRWEDEPWPLDDPLPAPGLRPTNWSDTHAEPPQVADLADEAWQYAHNHGITLERALAELQQREEMHRQVTGYHRPDPGFTVNGINLGLSKVAAIVPVTRNMLDDLTVAMPMSFLSYEPDGTERQRKAGDDAFAAVQRITFRPSPGFYLDP